ncbi:MAG: hypothetical protein JW986_03180 [Methanotrichaceae archaeon]|nr:hypothetical protein [Methanotrichaceae archaeon]
MIPNLPPIVLRNLQEVVGTLLEAREVDGSIFAKVGEFEVILPPGIEERLNPLMGRKVGILRVHTTKYCVAEVPPCPS